VFYEVFEDEPSSAESARMAARAVPLTVASTSP
jgi:hypothetical protein